MSFANLKGIEFRGSYFHRVTAAVNPGGDFIVGSAPDCDIVIPGEEILDRHARLSVTPIGVFVCPVGTAALSINGQPVAVATALNDRDWLALGNPQFQIKYLFDQSEPHAAVPAPQTRLSSKLLLGRSPGANLQISSPLAALLHAQIQRDASGRSVLEDFDTQIGSYVNLQRVPGRTALQPGDLITIAGRNYRYDGTTTTPVAEHHGLRIEICNVSEPPVSGKPVALQHINLVVEPGEFVAIISKNGVAGDSLLRIIRGAQKAPEGTLQYDDIACRFLPSALRPALHYVTVPDRQSQILPSTRALFHAARLRFPNDTTPTELQAHLLSVLQQVDAYCPLGRNDRKTQAFYTVLAAELLAKPRCLIMEYASITPSERTCVPLLRSLSDAGTTVISSFDDPAAATTCHLVAYLLDGQLVYYGPPQNAAAYFGIANTNDLFAQLGSAPASRWAAAYQLSPYFETYVRNRQHPSAKLRLNASTVKATGIHSAQRTVALMQRYIEELLAEQRLLAWTLLQTAALSGMYIGITQWTTSSVSREPALACLLSLALLWLGLFNSMGTLHRERERIVREFGFGLNATAVILSKIAPLGALCLLQSMLFTATMHLASNSPSGLLFGWPPVFLVLMLGTTLGLCFDAWFDYRWQSRLASLALLGTQALLSGLIMAVPSSIAIVAKDITVCYWLQKALETPVLGSTYVLGSLMSSLVIGIFLLLAIMGLRRYDSATMETAGDES